MQEQEKYFDIEGLKTLKDLVNKTYNNTLPKTEIHKETRNKLIYLAEKKISSHVVEKLGYAYKAKPNGSKGRGKMVLRDYIIVGYAPVNSFKGEDLFIKFAFGNLGEDIFTFEIGLETNFHNRKSPFIPNIQQIRDDANVNIPVDDKFPNNWIDLIELIKDDIQNLIKKYNKLVMDKKDLGFSEPLIEKSIDKDDNTNLNQIIYGPPGTGKTYKTKELAVEIIDGSVPEDREKLTERYFELITDGQIHFTTFHQSMSYEDFIEGIKPKMDNEEKGEVSYEVKDGIFKTICKRASDEKPDQKYVLIIDEINRGNVSAIFGELITLIEQDKRAGMDETIEVSLPYSKDKFSVPKNIYIIGTMNTADRSVEALDTALRRRFSFTEMLPDVGVLGKDHKSNGIISKNDEQISLVKLLKTINERIELLIDKDHQIGHSYFFKVKTFKTLKSTFKNKIIPLLEEYFYGDFGKIGLVLGGSFVNPKETKNKKILAQNFKYETDFIEEKELYEFVPFNDWNVKSFQSIYQSSKTYNE